MNPNIDWEKVKKVHFIGIGGSGMFPLAQILFEKGYEVTGSDTYVSDTLEKVKELGIKVFMGHRESNVKDVDVVVYTAAIFEDNPEILEAKRQGIPTISRAVMLGIIASNYKNTIAVAGTHGKTSTTSMITDILIKSGKSPSAIIGGKLKSINSNSIIGNSNIMVCEACEFADSFLQLHPEISVILNVDKDHLDYFKTFENLKKSFKNFINQTKGIVIYNGDDPNAVECVKKANQKAISFGLSSKNDYYAVDISENKEHCKKFTLINRDKRLIDISLKIPGMYNVLNAVAAAATAHILGVIPGDIKLALESFSGVHRRFEVLGTPKGITIVDDFAHNPTELESVLTCAKNLGFDRVWALFQPHTFSRTAMFLQDFARVLTIPDKAVISEILAVRETNIYNINARDLAQKIPGSMQLDTFEEIAEYVCDRAKPGDLIMTLGGGNVYRLSNMVLERLSK